MKTTFAVRPGPYLGKPAYYIDPPWEGPAVAVVFAGGQRAPWLHAVGLTEAEARAALYAAAPELLAACQTALNALDVSAAESAADTRPHAALRVAAKRQLRAAIAQATGADHSKCPADGPCLVEANTGHTTEF